MIRLKGTAMAAAAALLIRSTDVLTIQSGNEKVGASGFVI
jgi:hypothetical protein